VDALCTETAPAERLILVAQLRERLEEGLRALRQQSADLDALFEQVARSGAGADAIERMAAIAEERERSAAERFRPGIEALRQKLTKHLELKAPDVFPSLQQGIDIATGWLTLCRRHRDKLLKLAADRRGDTNRVRRARPVIGDVDYGELSREHIARYPKIRAALAK
jgi:hypothetical protein